MPRWRWIGRVLPGNDNNIGRAALAVLSFRLLYNILVILRCSYNRSFSTLSFKNHTSTQLSYLFAGESGEIDWRTQSRSGRTEKSCTTLLFRYSLNAPRTHLMENNRSNWEQLCLKITIAICITWYFSLFLLTLPLNNNKFCCWSATDRFSSCQRWLRILSLLNLVFPHQKEQKIIFLFSHLLLVFNTTFFNVFVLWLFFCVVGHFHCCRLFLRFIKWISFLGSYDTGIIIFKLVLPIANQPNI